MPNISQIEINNTTYHLVDAKTKDKIENFSEYYRWNTPPSTTNSQNFLNKEHGHIDFATGVGLVTGKETENCAYGLNLWSDTGNFRYDKYNFEDGTYATLGYIPLSNKATSYCYETTTDTALVTPKTNYGVNGLWLTRWGQIAVIRVRFTHPAISVPVEGRLSAGISLGTLNSAWRPLNTSYLHSFGDQAGQAWGYLTSGGDMVVTAFEATGVARTVAASTSSSPNTIDLCGTYIINMTNNYE